MKRLVKILLCCITILFVCGSLLSCNQKEAAIKQEIEQLNDQCPIVLGSSGAITKVEYEEGTVTFTYLVNEKETLTDIEKFKMYKSLLKELSMTSLASSNLASMETISNDDVDLRYKMLGSQSKAIVIIDVTSQELKDFMANIDGKPHALDYKLLDLQVQLANTNLPQKIEDGMLITQITQEGNNVVYKLSVDEELLGNDVNILDRVKDQLKSDITRSLQSEDDLALTRFEQLLKKLQYGLIYRFCGNHSGHTVDIYFSPDEISNILSNSEY
jgi:DNA-binding protein YbaB